MWFSGGIAKLWFLQLYQSKVVEGHLVRHLDFNQGWIVKKPRTRKVDTGFEGSRSIWPGIVCRQDICTEEGGIGKQPTWAFLQNLLRLQFSSMSRAFQAPFFSISRLGLSSETIFALTITRVLRASGLCETVNNTSWRFMIAFHSSCTYGIHIPYTAERWDILGNTPPEDQKDREIPRDLHH